MKTFITTTTTTTTLLTALCLAPVAGCDLEEAPSASDAPIGFRYCPTCIGNAPQVNGALVRELSISGQTNVDGISVDGIYDIYLGAMALDVDVTTGSLTAAGQGNVYMGQDLEGMQIKLMTPNGIATLYISEVATLPTWSDHGNDEILYRINYLDSQGAPHSVCTSSDPDGDWLTVLPHEIIIPGPTDVVTEDTDWFTLACVGEAAFKMKMLGYSMYSSSSPTIDERVATIRMVTADYCGNGVSFTSPGIEVSWADYRNEVTPPYAEVSMEAKWEASGAQCLSTPRFASIYDVLDMCDIPKCEDDNLDATWRTMLPW